MEMIEPGLVDWKKVVAKPTNKFHKVQNCNYVIDLGNKLGFHLTGIGGKDIMDAHKKFIDALTWQLIRYQTLKKLGGLKEEEIFDWASKRVTKDPKITSFRDPTIKNGKFLMNLLETIDPKAIDWSLVTPGFTTDEIEQNSKYILSVARKVGVNAFLIWEDIRDVKHGMIMTLVAGIFDVAKKTGK